MEQLDSGRPQRAVVRPGRLLDYEVSDLPYRSTAASSQPGLELTPPREGTTYGEVEEEHLCALMSQNALFSTAADTPARLAARPHTAAGADQTPPSADRAALEAARHEYERLRGRLESRQKGQQLSVGDPSARPVQPDPIGETSSSRVIHWMLQSGRSKSCSSSWTNVRELSSCKRCSSEGRSCCSSCRLMSLPRSQTCGHSSRAVRLQRNRQQPPLRWLMKTGSGGSWPPSCSCSKQTHPWQSQLTGFL